MDKLGKRVKVTAVTPLQNYIVHIVFEDGVEKKVDLEKFLHGSIFEPIHQSPEIFREVGVSGGTISWPNGADIDPDVLYYDLTPAWIEESQTVSNKIMQ